MIRIALHPRDPANGLSDQIEMIIQLKEQGYEIVKYADLPICIISHQYFET